MAAAPSPSPAYGALGAGSFRIARLSVPRLVAALFAADLLVGAAAAVAFGVSEGFGLRKIEMLRLGVESNLPTWYSSSQLLLVGLLLGAIPLRDASVRRPASLLLLSAPLLFVALSLDEVAMVHERVGWFLQDATGVGQTWITGPWMLVAVPVFLAGLGLAAYVNRPYWQGRPLVRRLFVVGAACFVGSAAGLEFAANFVTEGSLVHKALGFGEEVGEMIGATFCLWGALELLRLEGIRLVLRPREA